jgi:hypothetical protein
MILLSHSHDWNDWSALGGTCNQKSERKNHIECLARELDEESQHLLKINMGQCNLKNCTKLNYVLPTFHSRYQTLTNFDTYIYFVECQDPQETLNIIDYFNCEERQKNFRLIHSKNKCILEMSQLKFIDLTGDIFLKYFLNTLFEYNDRIKYHADEVLHKYTNKILKNVLEEVPQFTESPQSDHERFDIKFLAGLIDGLTTFYKENKWDPPLNIEEVIIGLNALLLEPGCSCTLAPTSAN